MLSCHKFLSRGWWDSHYYFLCKLCLLCEFLNFYFLSPIWLIITSAADIVGKKCASRGNEIGKLIIHLLLNGWWQSLWLTDGNFFILTCKFRLTLIRLTESHKKIYVDLRRILNKCFRLWSICFMKKNSLSFKAFSFVKAQVSTYFFITFWINENKSKVNKEFLCANKTSKHKILISFPTKLYKNG